MPLGSVANGVRSRARGLSERHGGPVVVGLLCLVVALGFGLRLVGALNPTNIDTESSVVAYQGNDSLAYEKIAAALYKHSSYGVYPMRHASDWSPGLPPRYAKARSYSAWIRDELYRSSPASWRLSHSRKSY